MAIVDLNSAEEADLRNLPGIGPGLAKRILDHRTSRGPFASVDSLRQVSGIGPAVLEQVRPYLRVVDAPRAVPVARGVAPEQEKRQPAKDRPPAGKKPPPKSPIDINQASETELRQLPGIGPTLAKRIIAARNQKQFTSVEGLRKVKGIGKKTFDALRPYARVNQRP
jgi:competence ComEA-like helix-hairpin-helix protein